MVGIGSAGSEDSVRALGKVTFHDLRRFEDLGTLEERDHVHLYTALLWHVCLKRKLRVVVLVNRKDPPKPRYIVLASTALELEGRKLGECYVARFQIECLFRDSKQFTGLSDCQARAAAAMTLSIEQGFPHWVAWGTILRGWALAEQGRGEEGVVQLRQGLAAYRATGAETSRPYLLALLAEAYEKQDRSKRGLAD